MQYTHQHPLRVVTLCSGYDSQCLALDRLRRDYPEFDYRLVAWAEFDPESSAPLDRQPAVVAHKALFPQWADLNLGDMTKIDWTQVEDFDLLFYSTPCQSISQAGLQHGFEEGSGTRSSIIWNVRDAVKVKRPRFLCLENVKAMVSSKFVGMFNLWQTELERLGYVNFAQVLNAKDYGVPQNRERIFLVSIRADGLDHIAGNVRYHFPKPFALQRRLKDVLEEHVDERYYLSDKAIAGFLKTDACKEHNHNFNPKDGNDIGFTIRCAPGSRVDDNFIQNDPLNIPSELEGKKFRIRKLTPRECFRLMGVDDADIDRIQAAGISNSAQYKLAGNSIVVDVLYHIFRRMFIDNEQPDFDGKPTQLTLF